MANSTVKRRLKYVAACEDPRGKACCMESQNYKGEKIGMPECRRCQYLHCQCGLCRECRVYHYISSMSMPQPNAQSDGNARAVQSQNDCVPKHKHCRRKFCTKSGIPTGGPLVSEYRSKFRPFRGNFQNLRVRKDGAFIPERPPYDPTKPKPPWSSFYKVDKANHTPSLREEEAKLDALDKLLQKEEPLDVDANSNLVI